MKIQAIIFYSFVLIFFASCRKSDYIVNDTIALSDDGSGTGTVTWKSNHEYILDGLVFVNDGQTLVIEPGTVIKARTGQGANASALIVARGGKIIAEGTEQAPIIFTVEGDDLEGSVPAQTRGLWGGVIILGNAPVASESGEAFIEGIPLTEPRGIYGGYDPNDNSGKLKYVSIRHSGTNLGEGNEINGLTLGGVGSGTDISFVEVISNADDGFEFFGGTVNVHHLIASYCDDDAFDFDMGYSGRAQYLYAIQSSFKGDNLCEHDGLNQNSQPIIANATMIGRGTSGDEALISFRTQSAANYYNSIFINQSNGILADNSDIVRSSTKQWLNDNIRIESNVFYQVGDTESLVKLMVRPDEANEAVLTQRVIDDNIFKNPEIELVNNIYDPIPAETIHSNTIVITDPELENASYRGAFYITDWTQNWSLTSETSIE